MPTMRVLLVDDSATSLFRTSIVVRRAGHEVLTAMDGEKAVEVALSERPDLILMDVEMPKMNGFEACRRLRQHAETRSTPIIMVSSRGETASREMGKRSGCTDYLPKPFDAETLRAMIQTHLEANRSAEAGRNGSSRREQASA